MTDTLFVLLDGHVAATITRTRARLELTYTSEHITRRDRTPLSLTMPVTDRPYGHDVISPWLDGLLPEGENVRRRWGQQYGVPASSPFALLGTPVGEDCAGAARFVTEERVEPLLAGEGSVRWLDDVEVGRRLRDLQQDSSAWLGEDNAGRFSLAGAQSKTAMLYDADEDRWGLPEGAAATSHIIKPAIRDLEDHGLNEHLCLRAAAICGILAAPSQIKDFGGVSAVVVTRYDRAPGEPWLARIHQEDASQALGVPPARKYQNEGGPSATDIARLLRAALPAADAEIGIWRLFDAMTLNWLIGGTDAHAKNYSLLLAGNQVALAPLYDVASTLPYDWAVERKLRLAMKFGADYQLVGRTPSVWDKLAKEFSLPAEQLRARAADLMDALPLAFDLAVLDDDVAALGSPLPRRLADAVAQRIEKDCRLALG